MPLERADLIEFHQEFFDALVPLVTWGVSWLVVIAALLSISLAMAVALVIRGTK